MRCANTFVLLGVFGLAVLTTRLTPCCVETILWPSDDTGQRRILRKTCRDTRERHRTLYGDRPVAEWPSERTKLIHANVERIMTELDETKP